MMSWGCARGSFDRLAFRRTRSTNRIAVFFSEGGSARVGEDWRALCVVFYSCGIALQSRLYEDEGRLNGGGFDRAVFVGQDRSAAAV